MLFYSVAILAWVAISLATPPPGYVKKPENDKDPPAYEYKYDVGDVAGEGHGKTETRAGEFASGRYYVNTDQAVTDVKYFADDWGYHPLVKYGSSDKHSSTTARFALGEQAVEALRNGGDVGRKVQLPSGGKKRRPVQIIQPYTLELAHSTVPTPPSVDVVVNDGSVDPSRLDSTRINQVEQIPDHRGKTTSYGASNSDQLNPTTPDRAVLISAATTPSSLTFAPLHEVRDVYANNDYHNAALIDEQLYLQSAGNFGEKLRSSKKSQGYSDYSERTSATTPGTPTSLSYSSTKQNGDVTYTVHSGSDSNRAYLSSSRHQEIQDRIRGRHRIHHASSSKSIGNEDGGDRKGLFYASTTLVPDIRTQEVVNNDVIGTEERPRFSNVYQESQVNSGPTAFSQFGGEDAALINYGLSPANQEEYGAEGQNQGQGTFSRPIVVAEPSASGYEESNEVSTYKFNDEEFGSSTPLPEYSSTLVPSLSTSSLYATTNSKARNHGHVTTSSVILNPIQAGVSLVNAGETHLITGGPVASSTPVTIVDDVRHETVSVRPNSEATFQSVNSDYEQETERQQVDVEQAIQQLQLQRDEHLRREQQQIHAEEELAELKQRREEQDRDEAEQRLREEREQRDQAARSQESGDYQQIDRSQEIHQVEQLAQQDQVQQVQYVHRPLQILQYLPPTQQVQQIQVTQQEQPQQVQYVHQPEQLQEVPQTQNVQQIVQLPPQEQVPQVQYPAHSEQVQQVRYEHQPEQVQHVQQLQQVHQVVHSPQQEQVPQIQYLAQPEQVQHVHQSQQVQQVVQSPQQEQVPPVQYLPPTEQIQQAQYVNKPEQVQHIHQSQQVQNIQIVPQPEPVQQVQFVEQTEQAQHSHQTQEVQRIQQSSQQDQVPQLQYLPQPEQVQQVQYVQQPEQAQYVQQAQHVEIVPQQEQVQHVQYVHRVEQGQDVQQHQDQAQRVQLLLQQEKVDRVQQVQQAHEHEQIQKAQIQHTSQLQADTGLRYAAQHEGQVQYGRQMSELTLAHQEAVLQQQQQQAYRAQQLRREEQLQQLQQLIEKVQQQQVHQELETSRRHQYEVQEVDQELEHYDVTEPNQEVEQEDPHQQKLSEREQLKHPTIAVQTESETEPKEERKQEDEKVERERYEVQNSQVQLHQLQQLQQSEKAQQVEQLQLEVQQEERRLQELQAEQRHRIEHELSLQRYQQSQLFRQQKQQQQRGGDGIEVQKSIEIYHQAPIQEIHYPSEAPGQSQSQVIQIDQLQSIEGGSQQGYQTNGNYGSQGQGYRVDQKDFSSSSSLGSFGSGNVAQQVFALGHKGSVKQAYGDLASADALSRQASINAALLQQQQHSFQASSQRNNLKYEQQQRDKALAGLAFEQQSSGQLDYGSNDVHGIQLSQQQSHSHSHSHSQSHSHSNTYSFESDRGQQQVAVTPLPYTLEPSKELLLPGVQGGITQIIETPVPQKHASVDSNAYRGKEIGDTVQLQHHTVEKVIEKTVHVPQPYPVHIRVPFDRVIEKTVHVPQPYPVETIVEKHVPVPQPYPVTVEKIVEKKIPYPVEKLVPQPYPVHIAVPQPYPVEKIVEKQVHVPQPYPVEVEKIVEKKVPYPVEVTKFVEKPVPIHVPQPYPVERIVEKPVHIRVPYPVDVTGSIPYGVRYGVSYQQIMKPHAHNLYATGENPFYGLPAFNRLQDFRQTTKNAASTGVKLFQGYNYEKPSIAFVEGASDKISDQVASGDHVHLQHYKHPQQQQPATKKPGAFGSHGSHFTFPNQKKTSVSQQGTYARYSPRRYGTRQSNANEKSRSDEYVGPVPPQRLSARSLQQQHSSHQHQQQLQQIRLHRSHQRQQDHTASQNRGSPASTATTHGPSPTTTLRKIRDPDHHGTQPNSGTFRQSKVEYGFKPPMIPSVQYDEKTASKVES